MKTGKNDQKARTARLVIAALSVLVVMLLPSQSLAEREPPPQCNPTICTWECLTTGAVDNPGKLSKTNVIICVGDTIEKPGFGTATFTPGTKKQKCVNPCATTYGDPVNITYSQTNWFEPELPTNSAACGESSHTVYVKGNDADCASTDKKFVGTFKVTVLKAEVKSVEFTSDHGIMKDNNTDWTDSGTIYAAPEWVKSPSRNNPITHTKNSSLTVMVTISVCPSGLTYDLKGDGGDAAVTFIKNGATSTGGDQTFTITANEVLPNQVAALSKAVTWTVKANGVTCEAGSSGAHKIYVTYATPSPVADLTTKRIDWAVTKCSGETTEHGCVAKIHEAANSYDLDRDPAPNPLWKIAGGAAAQCFELAEFYAEATHLLGIPGGEVVYIYPKPGKSVKLSAAAGNNETRSISGSTPSHLASTTHDDLEPTEVLYFMDNQGGPNSYEACFKFTSGGVAKYYAPGADVYDTPQEVMEAVCDYTQWAYVNYINPITHTATFGDCETPGPSPVDDWP